MCVPDPNPGPSPYPILEMKEWAERITEDCVRPALTRTLALAITRTLALTLTLAFLPLPRGG